MKKKIVILTGVALIIAFLLASFLFKGQQRDSLADLIRKNQEALIRPHAQTLGSADAKVVIVEFMDPGCETCRAFHPFLKQMIASAPGKIKLVMRYAPLHKGADYAVAMLEAARMQGKYWETLQVMYDTQPTWADHHNPQPMLLWKSLSRAGLNVEKVKKDMVDPAIAAIIRQDMADAAALQVTKTPGFFVNGKPLTVFGYDQLRELIEAELRANY